MPTSWKIPWESACWATGARRLREDHRVLSPTGDRLAAERPDRVGPPASALAHPPRTAPLARAGTAASCVLTETRECPPRPRVTPVPVPVPVEPVQEPQGCLYALSQPPLMLFLLVIGGLLGLGASYDLLFL